MINWKEKTSISGECLYPKPTEYKNSAFRVLEEQNGTWYKNIPRTARRMDMHPQVNPGFNILT
jgi:hypothetical protein